jgi:hypothetical protein
MTFEYIMVGLIAFFVILGTVVLFVDDEEEKKNG